MDLRDIIITPLLLLFIYAVAWYLRPRVCDENTRRYFMAALTVKIIGALAVGIIYQFYYSGGDTFGYHTMGSRIIWEALIDEPDKALKMIFAPLNFGDQELYKYHSRIMFSHDPASFMVVRIAAFFDIFTFSSYSSTAVLFAVLSFIGAWMLFSCFYREFPLFHREIALAVFFIPSVFFWGSGLLKDSVILSALGMLTYSLHRAFIRKDAGIGTWLLIFFSAAAIFLIKKYVLICFAPAVILWIYFENIVRVRSTALRLLLIPFLFSLLVFTSYYAVVKIGEDDPRYALDKIAQTSMITAYDIGFYSGKDAGSGYSLGELDGTFVSMLELAPQAINVTLFRPYLWEVKNPLMLLSSIESFFFLVFTVWVLFRKHIFALRAMFHPTILFCMVFSITFAFAVGVSTFNFGSLVRYKIPLIPFYALGLMMLYRYVNSERKVEELEFTE